MIAKKISKRERVLLTVAAVIIAGLAFFLIRIRPLCGKISALQKEVTGTATQDEIASLRRRKASLDSRLKSLHEEMRTNGNGPIDKRASSEIRSLKMKMSELMQRCNLSVISNNPYERKKTNRKNKKEKSQSLLGLLNRGDLGEVALEALVIEASFDGLREFIRRLDKRVTIAQIQITRIDEDKVISPGRTLIVRMVIAY